MTRMYAWRDVAAVPALPGIYAWYYNPEITTYDLGVISADVKRLKEAGDRPGAEAAMRRFLEQTVFRYFREQSFTATLRAPLMPRYEGRIEHQPTLSASLIERLVDDPDRLAVLKEVLGASVPDFASPLYIGMSRLLRDRVARHKSLIERGSRPASTVTEDGFEDDHSFAAEVLARGIPPTRLSVAIRTVEASSGAYVDLENVLNRIHRPLLGRN